MSFQSNSMRKAMQLKILSKDTGIDRYWHIVYDLSKVSQVGEESG